jgi:predicted porin
MKKTLVALAALASVTAFAQSTVGIKGTFDPSIAQEKTTYGDGASYSQNYVRNNSQGTSQITFFGTEDLGGGLKANFLYESDFDTRFDGNGNPLTGQTNFGSKGGEQFLGLEGSFGQIRIGAPNAPSLDVQGARQPFGTKIGGGYGTAMGTSHTRYNNSFNYVSPTVGGLTLKATTVFATNHDTNAAGTYNISTGVAATVAGLNTVDVAGVTDVAVLYANGPIAAGIDFYSQSAVLAYTNPLSAGGATSNTTAAGRNTQIQYYVAYTMGAGTYTFGGHSETTNGATVGANDTVKASSYNIAANYAATPTLNVLFNYGKLSDKSVGNIAAPQNKTVTAIGVKYALSKNTSVYARYVDQETSGITAAATAKSIRTNLIGMQTNF